MPELDLDELQKLVVQFRDERNWTEFYTPKDMAISLVLEASELLKYFQWKNEEAVKRHIEKNKEEVVDELADIMYWVLLITHDFDINIERAVLRKMQKNIEKYPVTKAKSKLAKKAKS